MTEHTKILRNERKGETGQKEREEKEKYIKVYKIRI